MRLALSESRDLTLTGLHGVLHRRSIAGIVTSFDPDDRNGIFSSFRRLGVAVVRSSVPVEQIQRMNNFCDVSQVAAPHLWAGLGDAKPSFQHSQPLIDPEFQRHFPDMDACVRPPSWFQFVEAVLGGTGAARFAEFNFRQIVRGGQPPPMLPHRDRVLPLRGVQSPRHPPDYLCALTYLTDVGPDTPAFAVLPASWAVQPPWDPLLLQPIYGAAGTLILYDNSIVHRRCDPLTSSHPGRRTMHQYFSRGGWTRPECWENNLRSKIVHVSSSVARPPTPALTEFVLIPPLLALHVDVSTRVFYSHWSAAMGEWAASGFPALIQAGSHAWIPASDAAVDDFVYELATAFDLAVDREVGSTKQAEHVLLAADRIIASPLGVERISTHVYNRLGAAAPSMLVEAVKAAEARHCMLECPPCHMSIVVPVWREDKRLRPRSEANPEGQAALQMKCLQLDWLTAGCDNVTWDMLFVDDGCDRGSADVVKEVLDAGWANPAVSDCSVRPQNVRVMHLQEGIDAGLVSLASCEESARGGALACGLLVAAAQRPTAQRVDTIRQQTHLVLYCDADLQASMVFAGFLAHRVAVGQCFLSAGSRYGVPRSYIVRPCAEGTSTFPHPENHNNQHCHHHIVVRHYFRRHLLPHIAGVYDTNAGFKCIRADCVHDIVTGISCFRKGFDSEFLMRSVLMAKTRRSLALRDSSLPGQYADISVVPILFVEDSHLFNSAYKPTINSRIDADFLAQIKDIAMLHRQYVISSTADGAECRLLQLIDQLTLESFTALMEGVVRTHGPRVPLAHQFSPEELAQHAGFR
jgi:hypothetical protein